mmetsp:Transcript_396/g.435  ORF Transcript_396/g.435 Transcript_396/m.435 type:complete len:121 (+) Transcript_396:452-814(+)
MLTKINSSEQHKQLISFLNGSIPGFDRLSTVSRDKIARCLTERTFMAGSRLIQENPDDLSPTNSNSAFIIKEGECVLMSQKNPALISFTAEGKIIQKKNFMLQFDNLNKKGYMSKTTNTF